MSIHAPSSWIIAAVRTPIGGLNGSLASIPAPRLGASCIRAVLERAKIPAERVDEVLMGNVVGAGIGQNPARQAAILGDLPPSVGATTINKVCGSGLKAVMLADQAIRLGESSLVVAGGMESMSRAPYLLARAREGYRMGHGELLDAMIVDGLWDAYGNQHMGTYGDLCAARFGFTRAEQDDFAVRSFTRARRAAAEGLFASELIPVEVPGRGGSTVVSADENPARFDEAKLRSLRPAFAPDGTITAGNASSVNDGAAALLLASTEQVEALGLSPLARVVGSATFSQEPEWFTTAPVGAVRKLLDRLGWSAAEVDLFEINEAFAAVAMVAERELGLSPEIVNIHGGAVALGHPIGCSGARVLVTLIHALRQTGGRRGIASLCIGGGEAVALAVETPG
jgi:acetyl-CoA C-acetyltransferase